MVLVLLFVYSLAERPAPVTARNRAQRTANIPLSQNGTKPSQQPRIITWNQFIEETPYRPANPLVRGNAPRGAEGFGGGFEPFGRRIAAERQPAQGQPFGVQRVVIFRGFGEQVIGLSKPLPECRLGGADLPLAQGDDAKQDADVMIVQ